MSSIDKRGRLQEKPFDYQTGKDGLIRILYHGKVVTRLQGKPAQKLLNRMAGATEQEVQLLLAKATGNFKRGNERQGKQKR